MTTERTVVELVHVAPYVTIERFASISGYSEKAIRRKIEDGKWVEGREYVRAPDNHVLVSVRGYARWVEGAVA